MTHERRTSPNITNPDVFVCETLGITHTRSPEHSSYTPILFCHLNERRVFDVGAICSRSKTFCSFHLSGGEEQMNEWNRCSGRLMLAGGGPAGLETRSKRDPISGCPQHAPPSPPPNPPRSLAADEAARCRKYTQLSWIKHLTHWLPDWWRDRRSHPGDLRGLGVAASIRSAHYTS